MTLRGRGSRLSDLRTRNLAVTTSKAFCASYARLSSTLDYQLVFKRFPLAEVSTRGVAERPAPPESLYA